MRGLDATRRPVAAGLPTVTAARALVLASAPLLSAEPVGIDAARGRVLAEHVLAERDVPAAACAAMDGYAVADPDAVRHRVVGDSRAGHPPPARLRRGEAVRISTGATLPPGARAVARCERAVEADGLVLLGEPPGIGRNVRRAAEDLRAGTVAVQAGTVLDAAALAVAAGAGRGTLLCHRRPRVAIVCTGDELAAPGARLGPGEIHNTNAVALGHLAESCGAQVTSVRRVGDERRATARALVAALREADVVVTSGGASAGEHDHVGPAMRALGVTTHFAGVALRPGKPTMFGTRAGRLLFGLPGNPVACTVAFALFVAPALGAAQGAPPLATFEAILATDVPRSPDREQALRVGLRVEAGTLLASPAGSQRSHVSSALVGADALAMIGPGRDLVAAGEPVPVVPLPGRCVAGAAVAPALSRRARP